MSLLVIKFKPVLRTLSFFYFFCFLKVSQRFFFACTFGISFHANFITQSFKQSLKHTEEVLSLILLFIASETNFQAVTSNTAYKYLY